MPENSGVNWKNRARSFKESIRIRISTSVTGAWIHRERAEKSHEESHDHRRRRHSTPRRRDRKFHRHYGDSGVGGLNFVGGVTKLGSDEAASVLSADFLGLVPGFFSTDAQESVRALDSLLRLCFTRPLSDEDRYLMLGYNVSVPPYVRQALLSRSVDNDDLLPTIGKPVLISHGADDAVVKPEVVDRQMARIRQAEVRMMAHAGHACFWDDAPAYNRDLQRFAESCNWPSPHRKGNYA